MVGFWDSLQRRADSQRTNRKCLQAKTAFACQAERLSPSLADPPRTWFPPHIKRPPCLPVKRVPHPGGSNRSKRACPQPPHRRYPPSTVRPSQGLVSVPMNDARLPTDAALPATWLIPVRLDAVRLPPSPMSLPADVCPFRLNAIRVPMNPTSAPPNAISLPMCLISKELHKTPPDESKIANLNS